MNTLKNSLEKHKQQIISALAATFLWGFAAHGYAFSDNSFSHDSLREFHAEILGNNIKMGSGRIFTPLYRDLLGSDVTMPWLTGILALLWIGLAVYLTARIFRVESKVTIALIAGIFTTNIAVSATTATYIHDLDSYMFSMLCAVAAVWCWKEFRFGWLLGAVFVTVSIGIYQAYLFMTVTLVMMDCIFRLLRGDPLRLVFTDGMKAVGMILLGGILYYVAMKGILALTGAQLVTGDYNSMDLILHQSPENLVKLVTGAYADWFRRIWNAYSSYPSILIKGINLVFLAVFAFGAGKALLGKSMGLGERLLCLVLIALLPLGMNLIYVLVVSRSHDLMTFPIWMVYLLPVLMGEHLAAQWNGEKTAKLARWLRTGCLVLMALLLYGNVRFSNGMYMKKDLEYDAYLSLMTRVVGRMEAEENYIPGETPVVFVGNPENRNDMIPGMKDYWNVIGMTSSDLLLEPERSRYQAYFDYVMNLPINLVEGDVWREVAASDEARAMPCYPAKGSVVFREGMLIVKLGQVQDTEMNFYEIPVE